MAKPPAVQPLGSGKWVRMAVIAKSGFGKTVFCGTAPNAIFLTTDPEGTVSAYGFGSTADEWQIGSWQTLEEAYRWLRDEGIEEEGYEWVILDNITMAQYLAMDESLQMAVDKNAKRDRFVPDKYEYQRSQNATINMVLRFNDLPVNIIYTSHRKGMEDSDGQDYYSAAIQGQDGMVAEQILGYMNIIAFGEVEKDKEKKKTVRRYYFVHHGPYRGKCRFISPSGRSVLGSFKDDLTVPEMMELINTAKGRSGTTTAKRTVAKKTATRRTTTARRASA